MAYSDQMTHHFDTTITKLMETPPVIDKWQYDQIGTKNDGPYREGYQNLPLKDNGEDMVPLGFYGISFAEYYMDKLYDLLLEDNKIYLPLIEKRVLYPFVWIRRSIAIRLVKADKFLRQHDLFLKVISGWRDPIIQQIAKSEAQKRLSEEEANRLFAKANIDNQKSPPPHATGGAMDVQLYSLQTFSQVVPTSRGDEYGFYNLEVKGNLSEEEVVKRNTRRILYHVLCTPEITLGKDEVFTIHPGEYWHFGDKDPLSAFLKRDPFACFGLTYPPKDYRITKFT